MSTEGAAGQEDREKKLPMYMFTPVDRYGDNKEETEPLQDLGTCMTVVQWCMTQYYAYVHIHTVVSSGVHVD